MPETEKKKESWVSRDSGSLIIGGATIIASIAGVFLSQFYNQDAENNSSLKMPMVSNESSVEGEDSYQKQNLENVGSRKGSGFKLEDYREVYDFAYSVGGMNQTSLEAKKFAELWVSKCADEPFEPFMKVYEFAYSAGGMNMTRSEAKEWLISKADCLND